MSFRALLVTRDDQAAEALTPVLSNFGLSVQCCSYPDALCLVSEQKFQTIIVDCDDSQRAPIVFQKIASASFENHPVTVALLTDKNMVRNVFGAGASFVLYKPLSMQEAEDTLWAATVLMKRERRKSFRVPIQVGVKIRMLNDGSPAIEGILLDLSESGMDVLAQRPLSPSMQVRTRFTLPNSPSEFEVIGEVAWANPNGETGVRFLALAQHLRRALHAWLTENSRASVLEETEAVANCVLTDLSLGGCYISTASPFPEGTELNLTLKADALEFQARGSVRVMHPAHGMGVELAMRTAGHRRQAEAFIQFLISRPEVVPELLLSLESSGETNVSSMSSVDDVDDPLLDLLRNHESFSEEMFLETLRGQRRSESQASMQLM
jgi:CheY-like chemotaxis protein